MTLPPKGAGEAVDEATEELEVPLVTAGEGPVAVAEEGLQMPVAVEGAEEEAEARGDSNKCTKLHWGLKR